ncbi:MAG: hypothetical protein ACRCVH_03475 [Vagococcus fluvialis]|uniref:hypothetical protein n=1 Tax=Vagococcus fluvialis TaxID=2738 RepID=UPI000A334EC2|nr:hypothetical protein [Vagococcus fluvialis]MBO0419423.1 hypothetical protein [Vagococcus fluvialis]OTP33312.1 hypothetical protein A5798_000041 [Enterococcus sp. 6C8_DIV0013]
MSKEKFKWSLLLFVAILSFIISLTTGNMVFNIIAIVLAVIIYKNGDEILFSSINKKNKEKREQARVLKEASRTIIKEGRLKK